MRVWCFAETFDSLCDLSAAVRVNRLHLLSSCEVDQCQLRLRSLLGSDRVNAQPVSAEIVHDKDVHVTADAPHLFGVGINVVGSDFILDLLGSNYVAVPACRFVLHVGDATHWAVWVLRFVNQ